MAHVNSTAPRLSVSTWSLHRTLYVTYPDAPDRPGQHTPVESYDRDSVPLLEIPQRIAAKGIKNLEICHFHLPGHDQSYLQELRAALDEAGVTLFSLLIDEGDITHPTNAARDLAWIGKWLDTAGVLGAQCARVIAGKAQPDEASLALSRQGFKQLVARAKPQGVRVMTENWFNLLSRPEHVLWLLDELQGEVGLCLDFGNWGGPTKYDDLEAIAPRAESCHTKAHFTAPGVLDAADYTRCLDITRAAGFSGVHTLIYDGPGDDEWAGLEMEQKIVAPYLQNI